ncbi:hypothetical protein KJ765_05775 [Candidatus Micrarchaeota archaeon]|nr:hypothetical protein [Candidatus Micrarchaeota archaeon]
MLSTPDLYTFQNLIFVLAYAFLGGGIKYIDQVFDEKIFNRKAAFILSILAGLIMGYLIAMDPPSATIFIAIVLGVAITKKIDNIAFYLGVLLVLAAPLFFRLSQTGTIALDMFSIFFLTVAALIDEWGNDEVDRWNRVNGVVKKFFYYRFTMKIMMAALVLTGTFEMIYLIAFLAFDGAYGFVDWYSQRMIRNRKGLAYSWL